ncbi:hypothetical protein [Paenibacillus sp. GYB003]|uniref:hypothetical protein n=1 Tax=Paenibacillus sp. GYB003 TaxID=2994392 RepID=UPI002F9677D5
MGIRGFYWSISEFLKSRSPKLFNIVAGKDGRLYEIRKEPIGIMVSRVERIAELEDVPTGFQFNLPKIPGKIMLQILCFFRDYCNEWDMNEVMVQIFWDTVDQRYIVECPHQWVKRDRIDATFNRHLDDENRFIEVCHIHSHNSMSAEFSETDNENEKAFMLYGVIGRLHRKIPEMQLRVGYNGKFFLLPPERIFDSLHLDSPIFLPYPTEWNKRVHIVQ